MEDSGWRRNKYGGLFNVNEYMNNKIRSNTKQKEFKLNDENLQEVIDESVSPYDDKYALLYLTRMNPNDFLKLTANEGVFKRLEQEKFELDLNTLSKANHVADMMYLDIDMNTGEVFGHEGRHRMYALKNKGYSKADVVVFARGHNKYNPETYTNKTILSQRNIGNEKVVVDKLTPVNKENEEKIKKGDY